MRHAPGQDWNAPIQASMNLCITFDHRIVDGSHVGPFMQDLKRRLEALGPDTPLT